MRAKQQPKKARVHADLGEFKLEITKFGEITGTMNIDKINDFLNLNLDDKKLENRDNLDL
jgi:hypothetical protein